MHAAGRDRSEKSSLRKVDVCRRYDSFCSGRKIRNAGRHFMCFQDAYFRFAAGGTAESAIGKAINLALQIQQKASRLVLLTRLLFGSFRRGKALCIWNARI